MVQRPRILFAWELGENFGHVAKIAEVARAIGDRASISVAARNPKALREIAKQLDIRAGPAPFAPYQRPKRPENAALAYSDNLAFQGWGSPEILARLATDWRAVFAREAPDLLVSQAAPTALLAARGTGLRTAILGSGFDSPPRATPMPPFIYWRDDPDGRAIAHVTRGEQRVLQVANRVLEAAGAPKLAKFADILDADHTYLMCWPCSDQYAPRHLHHPDHPAYLGHLYTTSEGEERQWPDQKRGKRILAYLRASAQGGEAALRGLGLLAKENDVLIASPGIPKPLADTLRSQGADVVDGPLRLSNLLSDADLGVSHASNGIAAAFIAAGLPQLGLPGHAEQAMMAQTVARTGVGRGLGGAFGPEHVADHAMRVATDAGIAEAARSIAAEIAENPDWHAPAKQAAEGLLAQATAPR